MTVASLVLVGPGLPAAVAPVLKSHEQAIQKLQQPAAPVAQAAVTFAGLPPPGDWPNTAIIVTDKACLAISVLQNGAYVWLRADGSAL